MHVLTFSLAALGFLLALVAIVLAVTWKKCKHGGGGKRGRQGPRGCRGPAGEGVPKRYLNVRMTNPQSTVSGSLSGPVPWQLTGVAPVITQSSGNWTVAPTGTSITNAGPAGKYLVTCQFFESFGGETFSPLDTAVFSFAVNGIQVPTSLLVRIINLGSDIRTHTISAIADIPAGGELHFEVENPAIIIGGCGIVLEQV